MVSSRCRTLQAARGAPWLLNERLLSLRLRCGFYSSARFHRVIPDFIAQVGIAADPVVYAKWGNSPIKDDPVKESNKRGYVSFAMRGPDTRSCQIFFNYKNNSDLDGQGFAPIAVVKEGMEVIDQLSIPAGKGPDQPTLKEQGNAPAGQ